VQITFKGWYCVDFKIGYEIITTSKTLTEAEEIHAFYVGGLRFLKSVLRDTLKVVAMINSCSARFHDCKPEGESFCRTFEVACKEESGVVV